MTTYHSPLWLIDWDYEESDDMGQTYEDDLAELRGWLEDAHKRITALESGLRDLLPGAQWTARFDPDLRATVARIEALLHNTTPADEREARREPPFAVLPEVY